MEIPTAPSYPDIRMNLSRISAVHCRRKPHSRFGLSGSKVTPSFSLSYLERVPCALSFAKPILCARLVAADRVVAITLDIVCSLGHEPVGRPDLSGNCRTYGELPDREVPRHRSTTSRHMDIHLMAELSSLFSYPTAYTHFLQ